MFVCLRKTFNGDRKNRYYQKTHKTDKRLLLLLLKKKKVLLKLIFSSYCVLRYKMRLFSNPVGKIAQKAVCRSVFKQSVGVYF